MRTHRRLLVPMMISTLAGIALILLSCSTRSNDNIEPSTVDPRCLIYQTGSCPYGKPVEMSSPVSTTTSTSTTVDLSFLNTTTTTVPRPPVQRTAPVAQPSTAETWDQLAQCEAGGNWSANTGNGYGGGLQFAHGRRWSTWTSFGGSEFSPHPWEATREQQIVIAERVLASSGWRAWPGCARRMGLL